MAKKKVRSSPSSSISHSKHSKRSRSRSPLPSSVDPFGEVSVALYFAFFNSLFLLAVPLSSLISDHEKLTSTAVHFVGWKTVESMLPPCLQGRSRDDVIQLVSDELDGMSRRRISCILEGNAVPSSSSSEVSEGNDQSDNNSEEHERDSNGVSDTSSDVPMRNTSPSISNTEVRI
uniref:Uncharacterized protein n=1 Tax=Haemonchus contortus TaxID=6289 RepID=A0A7I4Y2M9_HAECO